MTLKKKKSATHANANIIIPLGVSATLFLLSLSFSLESDWTLPRGKKFPLVRDVAEWGGSKGVINFPWIFLFIYAMRSLVPSGHFRNISGHYSLGLFAGLLNDAMGYCLLVVSCEMTRTKRFVF